MTLITTTAAVTASRRQPPHHDSLSVLVRTGAISRQRAYQIRKQNRGLCISCGTVHAIKGTLKCARCLTVARQTNRDAKDLTPGYVSGLGRPASCADAADVIAG